MLAIITGDYICIAIWKEKLSTRVRAKNDQVTKWAKFARIHTRTWPASVYLRRTINRCKYRHSQRPSLPSLASRSV